MSGFHIQRRELLAGAVWIAAFLSRRTLMTPGSRSPMSWSEVGIVTVLEVVAYVLPIAMFIRTARWRMVAPVPEGFVLLSWACLSVVGIKQAVMNATLLSYIDRTLPVGGLYLSFDMLRFVARLIATPAAIFYVLWRTDPSRRGTRWKAGDSVLAVSGLLPIGLAYFQIAGPDDEFPPLIWPWLDTIMLGASVLVVAGVLGWIVTHLTLLNRLPQRERV